MKRIVLVIVGPDSDKALAGLIANCEFVNAEVAVWISDNPNDADIGDSTLSFAPFDFDGGKEEIKH